MGMFLREVSQSQVDVEDLFYMLQQKPAVQEAPDAKEFRLERGSIEFRGVSFGHKRSSLGGGVDSLTPKNPSYERKDGDDEELKDPAEEDEVKYLFKDLNLKIEAGTTNAIVGPSGFGKTSMLHLLFRIYDPVDG